ncbi:MAG: tyrosine recombinase XerC [Vicingaceae bacterium]|nr:tyrosine recombinase XerC [Vicingaceae bacterium]
MPHISDFCDYLQHQKRYSLHTVTAYQKDLEQFQQFLLLEFETESFKDVSASFIRSWIVKLIEEGISPRTINRKISSLKSFYKHLLKNKLVDKNPLLKVITPKTSKRLPVFVGENEINNLFENIKYDDDYEGKRDQLILELFYATGTRLSELIELKLDSIDFNNSTIKVLGKRNKERLIPIGKNLTTLIKEYIKEREKLTPKNSYFFLTKIGKKLYPKLVYSIVNSYLSQVTTVSKKSPHVLRHTFATHMLNNGADLNTIKEILGHANLSATQVYTHNTIEKLKNIHKQAHPKA